MKMKKINNRGVTLVELLIAIAIGSIVISAVLILFKQGMNGYSKQTITAQLQDDANITLNQMTDAIMEATCIDISNPDSLTKNTLDFTTKSDNVYSYDKNNKMLFVGTTAADGSDYSHLSILCKHVEIFKIEVINTSVRMQNETKLIEGINKDGYSITSINDPVQIKVSLTLKYNGITRKVTRVSSLRNKIDDIKIQGMTVKNFWIKGALADFFTD